MVLLLHAAGWVGPGEPGGPGGRALELDRAGWEGGQALELDLAGREGRRGHVGRAYNCTLQAGKVGEA